MARRRSRTRWRLRSSPAISSEVRARVRSRSHQRSWSAHRDSRRCRARPRRREISGGPGKLCVLISGPCSRIKQGTISWGALDGTANDVAARLVIALEGDQAALRGFLEQLVERAEAVVALVESRAAALQRLLDHRAPDLVLRAPLGEQGVDGGEHEVERLDRK